MTQPTDWALVGNASDPEQVKRADEKVKRRDLREEDDLAGLLELAAFKRWAWRELDMLSANASVIGSSPEMTYYKAGQQDHAHRLIQEFEKAKAGSYLEIIKAHSTEKG